MKIWWITLASTFILCYFARMMGHWTIKNQKECWRANLVLAFFACAILICVAGFRSAGIGDTGSYIQGFDKIPSNWEQGFNEIKSGNARDKGFSVLSLVIKTCISEDSQIFLFVIALLTIGCIFIVYYQNVYLLEMAVFLFITSGCYLVTMNGMRQYLVTAILFLAFPWIYQRKWYYYIPLVLLLSTVHKTCLIFIPLYFVVNQEAWGVMTKLMILAGIGLFVTYPVTGPMIADLLQESQYSEYSGVIASTGAGANMIRVIVMSVPVVLAYLGRNYDIKRKKYYNIMVNMTVVNLIFILLATRYWIYARFNMYFMVYMIVLLVWEIEYLFDNKNTKLVYLSCIGLYSLYYYYEMHISLGFGAGYQHF